MNMCDGECHASLVIAALLILAGALVACSPPDRSAEGAGTSVAPDSENALMSDQPAYVQRYPCAGAQAKCWGAPSW
jgi:hypothetical protein